MLTWRRSCYCCHDLYEAQLSAQPGEGSGTTAHWPLRLRRIVAEGKKPSETTSEGMFGFRVWGGGFGLGLRHVGSFGAFGLRGTYKSRAFQV